jgi:hypothetical protein
MQFQVRETTMNEQKTVSMLRRLPVILAVTAASYGLTPGQAVRPAAPARGKAHLAPGRRLVTSH